MSDRLAMPPTPDPAAFTDPPATRVVVTTGNGRASRGSGAAGWAIAAIAFAWLGGRLGEDRFATLVGGGGIELSGDFGLASGLRLAAAVPGAIVDLARLDAVGFGLGFLLLAIPIAGLVAARPEGPRTGGAVAIASVGAGLATAVFLGILSWLGGTTRGDVLAAALLDAKQFPGWIDRLDRIAGLDWMLFLAAAAWTVLAFRLPLPRWARIGTGSLGVLTAFACWFGGSATLGCVEQFERPRPMAFTGTSDASREPVLGSLGGRAVAMSGGEFPGLHTIGEGRVAFSSPQSLRKFLMPPLD